MDKARCIDLDIRADARAGLERVSVRGAELVTPVVVHSVRSAAQRWREERTLRQGHQLSPEQVDDLRGVVARAVVAGITEHFGLAGQGQTS
jgi:hypothetical protein